jgi:hypothetical protein
MILGGTMNGFIPRTLLGLALCASGVTGCACYREIVDPCWPERYNSLARASVNEMNNAQAFNGHILDQTIWNYDFEHDLKTGAPTDVLNAAGMERLKYLSRRRPAADCRIYLATAQDLPDLATAPPEAVIQARHDLNSRRIVAIQKFLTAQTNGIGGFTVDVHDPAEVGLAAMDIVGQPASGQPTPGLIGGYQKLQANFQGAIVGSGAAGAGGAAVGGPAGAGGGAPPPPR